MIYIYSNSKSETSTVKKKPNFNIKVFIIENENDAISIWNNLTEDIDFSSPATLIRISSHFTNGFYYLPKLNHKEYISLNELIDAIKKIDLQTISLALTGLFNKIVWVYPMWIPVNYIFTLKEQYLGVNNNNLCICSFNGNITHSNDTSCENIFPIASKTIDQDNCQLLNNHWKLLSMQEIYALVSLNQITLSSPIIVNINLDFFTVEQSNSLATDRKIIKRIESNLNSLFCVKLLSDEMVIDAWFRQLAKNIKVADTDQLFKMIDMPTSLFCQSQTSFVKKKIVELLKELQSFEAEHLKELTEAGICIREYFDPKQIENIQRLKVCRGYDVFNDTNTCVRHMHSCIDAELHLQMEKIVQILQQTIKHPTVISIVRSSRNGIVSPKNQHFLENSLLSQLKSIYKLKSSDIIYNDNLLGGSNGWFLRNKIISSNSSIAKDYESDNNN